MAEKGNGPELEAENNNVEAEIKDKEKSGAKLTVAESVIHKLQEQPSMISRASRRCRVKKKIEKRKKCVGQESWNCEEDPLWRIYMKTYAEKIKKCEEEETAIYGEYYRKKPSKDIPRLPVCLSTLPINQKMNVFNANQRVIATLPNDRMWEKMCDPFLGATSLSTIGGSDFEWPKLYPCTKRDVIRERKILARKAKMKKFGALPCKIDQVNSPESSDDENLQEIANLKELGHARIPRTAAMKKIVHLVDRACGERPGLVEGDFVLYEIVTRKGDRTYANICLRGLTGMHLGELGRVRERTWKFCVYQALVALLTKTQFRYKYVWSANIDYIYEHAWHVFLHVGYINVMENQRFDDFLVYNYKYSIELELVQELKNVEADMNLCFKFFEKGLYKRQQCPRKELTQMKSSFGEEKEPDCFNLHVHKSMKDVEKWFDKLEDQFTNCIYRTTRFSLAFWQDGPFWYIYIPYNCDKYGFWDDSGAACIVKFCTRTALKRHLMLLTLRAYAYEASMKKDRNESDEKRRREKKKENFTVQIFQVIYHSCQIHNIKLYKRQPFKAKVPPVEKKPSDPCTFDPVAHLAPKTHHEMHDEEVNEKIEKSEWVRDLEITWTRNTTDTQECKRDDEEPPKWHMFNILRPRRLYVLWGGEMHISHKCLPKENHNLQAGTCYAVSAGMLAINAPEYWGADVLNAIVICGDSFFSQRKFKLQHQLGLKKIQCANWDAMPNDQFRIDEMLFDMTAHPSTQGHLFSRNQSLCLSLEQLFQLHKFAILNCESSSFGVFKHYGAYYALDVQSYGPPIYMHGRGGAYLLRAPCLVDLVKCLVLVIGTPECRKFQLRPIDISKVMNVEEDPAGKEFCKVIKCLEDDTETGKTACLLADEGKKAAKKKGWKPVERKKVIDCAICVKKNNL